MKPIPSAKDHINAARSLLIDQAIEKDGLYVNRKYVRRAGRRANKGLIKAIDSLLINKEKQESDWYQDELFKIDKEITADFSAADQILNRSMGLNGTKSIDLVQFGLEKAEKIVNWVENRLTLIQNEK